MRRAIIIVFSLLIASSVFSQEKLKFNFSKDYKSILEQSKDNSSKIYYNNLFARFSVGDSTLTNYEMLALQIGFTDNDKYYPYQDITLEREIWSLNEEKKFDEAKLKLDTLLMNNPFSILGHREMSYVQSKLGNKDLADLHYQKFDQIVASVLSTGDGKSYETSWFTLSPADGQWIIKLAFRESICSMGSGRDDNGNFHDILGIKFKDSEDCIKLYFNIAPASKRMFGKEGLNLEELEGKSSKKKKKKRKKNK